MTPVPHQLIHRRLWRFARAYWSPNHVLGHGPDHARRAYRHAMQLAERLDADKLTIGAACLLMDAGLNPVRGRSDHITRSTEIANEAITLIPELQPARQLIIDCILHHEAEDIPPEGAALERLIVRESDTLDRLGLTGVRMTLRYGIWCSRPLYNLTDPVCLAREPQLNDFTLDYIRYLVRLGDLLTTPVGQELGEAKRQQTERFIRQFQLACEQGQELTYDQAFIIADEYAFR